MSVDIRRMSKKELDELNARAALWPRCKPLQHVVSGDVSLECVAETPEKRQITQLDLDL
jgi:hypothetical protein